MIDVKSTPTWELKNIVQALNMLPFLNTQEDKQRLSACKLELRRRSKLEKTRRQRNNHEKKIMSPAKKVTAYNKQVKREVHERFVR